MSCGVAARVRTRKVAAALVFIDYVKCFCRPLGVKRDIAGDGCIKIESVDAFLLCVPAAETVSFYIIRGR